MLTHVLQRNKFLLGFSLVVSDMSSLFKEHDWQTSSFVVAQTRAFDVLNEEYQDAEELLLVVNSGIFFPVRPK